MILLRASLRHLLRHPWQAGLSILGIALGVAVVVSVDLASGSARRAFGLSAEGVTGRATHQIVGGPGGLDERVVGRLARELGVHPLAPVVEAWVGVEGAPGRALQLLGIDPFSEAPFRPYLGRGAGAGARALGTFVTEPGAVLLARETAAELGVAVGDALVLRVTGRRRPVRVVGLIDPEDARSRQALAGLVVADVATAQELLDRPGRLSRVDLALPEGARGEETLGRVRAILPSGAEVVPAAARSEFVGSLTRAFDVNLTALSLLALVVGALSRLQHHDVLGGPATRDARDGSSPRRHARRDRRGRPGRRAPGRAGRDRARTRPGRRPRARAPSARDPDHQRPLLHRRRARPGGVSGDPREGRGARRRGDPPGGDRPRGRGSGRGPRSRDAARGAGGARAPGSPARGGGRRPGPRRGRDPRRRGPARACRGATWGSSRSWSARRS